MRERVDKNWHSKGLDAYSVEAILGTLAHYGVAASRDSFVTLAHEDFPLTIARRWEEHWKGKGQFARFPVAAAEELWRRLNSGPMAPSDLSLALTKLLGTLQTILDGKADDGTWDTRFKVVEAYLPRVPAPGERREKFMAEVTAMMGERLEALGSLPEELARGHSPLAGRLAAIEGSLFPMRQGTTAALIKAAQGDIAGAVADLLEIAGDLKRGSTAQLHAIDGLLKCKHLEPAKRFTLQLVDLAQRELDVELAAQALLRLSRLWRMDPQCMDRTELKLRAEQLSRAFPPGAGSP